MERNDEIRSHVSEAYKRAVTAGAGCCGSGDTKGYAVQVAGYGDELADLPEEVVLNSFGCGNPLAFSDVQPGQTVIDLGCGAGIDLLIAWKKVGPAGHVIGIDMTDEMIDAARRNIAKAGADNVEVRKGLIEELPVEDASVDWVISNCVINLSPEKEKVFAEIARVLKPGGTMQVSDIVARNLPDWVRQNHTLYNTCIGGAIPEEEYIAGLGQAGLTDIEVLERLVYDDSQVRGLIISELDGEGCGCSSCGGSLPADVIARASQELTGGIWSAKLRARKPL